MKNWSELGSMSDNHDTGSDIQVGDGFSRSFYRENKDGTFDIREVVAYASSEFLERDGVYEVEVALYSANWDDPEDASTEGAADYTYEKPYSVGYATLEEANNVARNYIVTFDADKFLS